MSESQNREGQLELLKWLTVFENWIEWEWCQPWKMVYFLLQLNQVNSVALLSDTDIVSKQWLFVWHFYGNHLLLFWTSVPGSALQYLWPPCLWPLASSSFCRSGETFSLFLCGLFELLFWIKHRVSLRFSVVDFFCRFDSFPRELLDALYCLEDFPASQIDCLNSHTWVIAFWGPPLPIIPDSFKRWIWDHLLHWGIWLDSM